MEVCEIKKIKSNLKESLFGRAFENMVRFSKECVFNVPNMLSFFRILMIIPFVISFLKGNYVLSLLILCISGITDILDGIIARKTNQITKLGKFLDPVSDKLTLIAVVICLSLKFSEIIPFVGILLVKDLSMLVAGGVLIANGVELPAARWYGKISTAAFYVSVISLVLLREVFLVNSSLLTVLFFSVTTALMVFSLFKYFVLCLDLLKK